MVFCEHKALYMDECEVPEGGFTVPFGQLRTVREGSDITLCAMSRMVGVAEAAAAELAKDGVNAEIIDPRTLSPLDDEGILASVAKTGRLVVVDEANPICSMASEIAALAAERGFDYLDAPVRRVMAPHTPVPATPSLEALYVPTAEKVVAAARATLDY